MSHSYFQADWHYPTRIMTGPGRIEMLPDCCRSLGIQRPLLVTDPGLATLAMVRDSLTRCQQAGLKTALFSDIRSNPDSENIEMGIAAFRAGQHDGVIALGGGSALDAGKAIAMLAGQQRPLWDFEDEADNWQRADIAAMAPVIAIPTTAGTGAEVGRVAVITDPQQQRKRLIFHPAMMPDAVILDPELTRSLPPGLTAATGMDALAHNLEALCAPGWHPMANGIALQGIRLIHRYLILACEDGDNLEARAEMQAASLMGATAFQKGLGAMHALAHPLGARYDAHHGLLNAILMPYVLAANRPEIDPILTRCARYLDLAQPDADGLLQWVLMLRQRLQIPDTLSAIGIDDQHAQQIGEAARQDPSAATNPQPFSAAEYSALFRQAVQGH